MLGTPGVGIVVLLASGPVPVPGPAVDQRLELLRSETELARSGGFYLRLDAGSRRLSLLLEGVTLEQHAVSAIDLGVPRVGMLHRPLPTGWDRVTHTMGRLDPPRDRDRLEIVAPGPGPGAAGATPTPPPIPPSAEEAYSVPARFRVRFADGLSLEIVAPGPGRNRGLFQRALDAARLRRDDWLAALTGEGDRLRVRVSMTSEAAAELYRSLPPDVSLLVATAPSLERRGVAGGAGQEEVDP